MFRWKKRDEGFEWHQYVRTTIKLRREARREKAQKLGEQVAGGARAAGVAADVLAKNSARRLGDAARAAVVGFGRSCAATMGLAGLGLGSLSGLAGRVAAPTVDFLGRPGIGGPLTFIGLIAAVAGIARIFLGPKGLDVEAASALGIGIVLLLLGFAPALWLGHAGLPKRMLAPITGLPSRPWQAAACAGIALLVAGIGVAVMPSAVPTVALPQFASFQTFSLATSETVAGRAHVIAADTLRIGRRRIRLSNIEVPDPHQRCLKAGARSGGRTWDCGHDARETLQRLVSGRSVTCETGSGGANDVASGRCEIKGADVAEALVKTGYAFAQGAFMPTYGNAEAAAKESKSGIWSSAEPERPAQWRDRLWTEAKQKAPDGCPIKGRLRGRERIYLLPWDSNYARVRIRTRRGERWFCSQDEAEAAGWHSSQNG
jgi:endonuclease YncB( thermonuclease family)